MIDWRAVPEEYKYFYIDNENTCRFSSELPDFDENGKALFRWMGYGASRSVRHKTILAEYFKGFDLSEAITFYSGQTVIKRPNT